MSRERLVYGFHAVAARIRQDPGSVREVYVLETRGDARLRDVIGLATERGVRVAVVPAERLDRMLPGVRHQGVACAAEPRRTPQDIEDVLDLVDGPPLLLVLDGVTDPHNLGACLRSADAMGVHAVMAPKDRAVGLTPVVEKVACGAAETVPYVMVTNLARSLDQIKERGVFVIGMAGESRAPLAAQGLDGPVALVLGAEGHGMRRLTRERCDALAVIPMVGTVESLNVSVAAGICLYEARRQRLAAGR